MVVGDAIGNDHIAFARPDLHAGPDHDPARGAKIRLKLLDYLANNTMAMSGYHLHNGGMGHVDRSRKFYISFPNHVVAGHIEPV